MIEAAPRPLAGILGPRAGAWLTALHRAEGVVLRTGVTVTRDLGDALELADGTRVARRPRARGRSASRPAAGWLAGSGLDPAGVAVDGAGRTGLPGVYAAGDVTGSGHWEAAARGGAAVARALLGRPDRAPGAAVVLERPARRAPAVRRRPPRRARSASPSATSPPATSSSTTPCDGRTTAVLLAGRPPSALRAARARLDIHRHHHQEGRMSLIARIEDDLCLAHGDCEAVAPEAFRVDDVARVVGETTDERLRAAARACPAGAIVLYDADTGEEVEA